MKTISMFKDEYLLDFINTENLGLEIEDIDERVVEQEIVRNMRDFILQFGKDFIFLKSASNLNGNLNSSKELEHYASG